MLFQQLDDMKKAQKVDISIVNTLDKLIENCKGIEQFWIKNEKIPIENSFLLYHALRNSRLVFEKMKTRFIKANKTHENPKIVEDSILVLPMLSELCNVIFALREREITPEICSFISRRLKSLRNIASHVSLLPSPSEEIKSVNRRKLMNRFSQLTDTLQGIFGEV